MARSEAPEQRIPLAHYPIQLVAAYLHQATVRRSVLEEGKPRDLTFNAFVRAVGPDRGGKKLAVIIGGRVTAPFGEAALLTISCDVTGEFVAATRRRKADLEAFGNREAILILWPFLRAEIGGLAARTAIPVPPIPMVDVLEMIERRNALTATPEAAKPVRVRRQATTASP